MNSSEIAEQIRDLENSEKELRTEFTRLAWIVADCSPEAESDALKHFRDFCKIVRSNDATQRELHIERKRLEKEEIKALVQAIHQSRQPVLLPEHLEAMRQKAERTAEHQRLTQLKRERQKAQAEAEKLMLMAAEEKRDAIIRQAISTGRLSEVVETREEKMMNDQHRSNGGVVRIESGAGK